MTGILQPGEAEAVMAALADAQARYWATLDEPQATEADRIDAADNLDRVQTLTLELLTPHGAEPEAEAEASV
jgi:hypothetical protein